MPRHCFPLALLAALILTPALAAPVLDGWTGYKFGMSPDAARAVPGLTFGPYSAKNLAQKNIGAMAAKTDVPVNGRPYRLNLYFDSGQRLSEIGLGNQVKAARGECEQIFLTVLSQMDKSYGGFAPVNPQHAKTAGDQLPASIVWRTQGPSRYELSTVFFDAETASAWKARKVIGGSFVDIATTWSGAGNEAQSDCITELAYAK